MEAHPLETHEPGGHTMASARYVVLINQPIEVVFGALATLQHVPRWTQVLEEDEGGERETPDRGSEEPPGRLDRSDPHRERPFEITGYESPRRLTLAGHIGRFEALAEYSSDEMAIGTLVTLRVEVDLSDLFLNGDVRLATSRIEAAVSRSLERWKQLLEAEDAT
jgi:Polyketide cyclase / dehydrase and lipid transport